jgi:hypothetical protein
MVDHLACAENYRKRADKCRAAADKVSSARFGDCYRLVADYYLFLANYEEAYGGIARLDRWRQNTAQ